MSRAKRTRKARMKSRQAKRFTRQIESVSAFLVEQRERIRFGKQLMESDTPEEVKTVLRMILDPVGFTTDMLNKYADRVVQR